MTWGLQYIVAPTMACYAGAGVRLTRSLCDRQLWDEGRPYRVQLDNGATLLLHHSILLLCVTCRLLAAIPCANQRS